MQFSSQAVMYIFVVYCIVFSIIGAFFFVVSAKALREMHDMVKSIINLIHYNHEDLCNEGTDTD